MARQDRMEDRASGTTTSSNATGVRTQSRAHLTAVEREENRRRIERSTHEGTCVADERMLAVSRVRAIRDVLCLLVIRLLRGYALHTPIRKGLWRINELVAKVARSLSGEHRLIIRSLDGRRFAVNPKEKQYHMGLLGTGLYEPVETRAVTVCLSEGDTAFDVGANIGWYTTLLSRCVGVRGTVHAFEPIPSTYQVLEGNCKLNACSNVLLNHGALSEREGRMMIHYFPDEPCGNASMVRASTASSVEFACDVTTLDGYMAKQQLNRCDFIKCDAEGAELAILNGASQTLRTYLPTILIELNPATSAAAGYSSADLLRKLQACGPYRFFSLNEHSCEEITDLESCSKPGGYSIALCVPDRSVTLKKIGSALNVRR